MLFGGFDHYFRPLRTQHPFKGTPSFVEPPKFTSSPHPTHVAINRVGDEVVWLGAELDGTWTGRLRSERHGTKFEGCFLSYKDGWFLLFSDRQGYSYHDLAIWVPSFTYPDNLPLVSLTYGSFSWLTHEFTPMGQLPNSSFTALRESLSSLKGHG